MTPNGRVKNSLDAPIWRHSRNSRLSLICSLRPEILLGFPKVLGKIFHEDGSLIVTHQGAFVPHALDDAIPGILVVLFTYDAIEVMAGRAGAFQDLDRKST